MVVPFRFVFEPRARSEREREGGGEERKGETRTKSTGGVLCLEQKAVTKNHGEM